MRDHLVVLRCGAQSRHPAWLAETTRNFDLVRCPYQGAPEAEDLPALSRTIPGHKWSGLSTFLREQPVWRDYRYVWLPDDDLVTCPADISRFFDLCVAHDAALAAPALTEDSHYSHVLTLRNRAFRVRATTFVEVMAPCFRRDVLERLLPTFSEIPTGYGWGLDYVWPRLLGYQDVFLFDEVTVLHDRPVGGRRSRAARRAAKEEMWRVCREYDAPPLKGTLLGLDACGERLDAHDPRFLDRYLEGYRWLIDRKPAVEARLRRDQVACVATATRVATRTPMSRTESGWPRDAS